MPFNPITSAKIPLPHHIHSCSPFGAVGALSALAPHHGPDCNVLLVIGSCVVLYRPNKDRADWTTIQLPALHGLDDEQREGSATYCGGKFFYSWDDGCKLYVIGPSLQKAATSLLVMRNPEGTSLNLGKISLQEIHGELFSVWMSYKHLYDDDVVMLFRVFKADLSGREWVSVETLGDHTLFYEDHCSVFLLAADAGCKRNSIYACSRNWYGGEHYIFLWGSFDLGTGMWTEEDTLTMHENCLSRG